MDIDVVVEGSLSDAQIEVLVAGLSRKVSRQARTRFVGQSLERR